MKILKAVIVLTFITLSMQLFAQDFEKSPKQYSLELGYRYNFSSNFVNNASSGYGMLFDYAWQLSGFKNKKAAYISVPLGYTSLMPNSATDKRASILSYGWTVRHELAKGKSTIPYIGYCLLLNQYRESGTDGSIFGHQTKFDFGFNFKAQSKFKPYAKLEYSYTRYPRFGKKESYKVHAAEVKLGIRY